MSLFDTDLESLQSLANDGLTLPSMSAGSDAATASTPATPVTPSSTSPNPILHPIDVAQTAASNAVSSWIFSSRFAAVVLGLICIAGAIFLFKGPSVISAAKGASVA